MLCLSCSTDGVVIVAGSSVGPSSPNGTDPPSRAILPTSYRRLRITDLQSGDTPSLSGGCSTGCRRALLPHTRVLLHQPSAGGQGTISDLSLQADELLRVRSQMDEVLSAHTGQNIATLRADTDRDKMFTAEQAVEYGRADTVISEPGNRGSPTGVT